MPHKHKRREQDDSQFNLPPSMIAKALPVRDLNQPKKQTNGKKQQQKSKQQQQKQVAEGNNKPTNSRRKGAKEDDTPKAFQRLMQFRTTGRRAPSGLETGEKRDKKRKREDEKEGPSKKSTKAESQQAAEAEAKAKAKLAMPKILPGEKLSDFSARVDRALPLSQMSKSTLPNGAKNRDHKVTKHEKHLKRLQAGWRADDIKIKEKEEAEREERAEAMEEQLELMKEWDLERRGGKAKKKGAIPKKKKKGANADADVDIHSGDDDPDPWAKLKKRDKERKANVNPFDVAKAPPTLQKPREIFKVRGGAKVDVANVPNAVGSLRRREELAGERRNIVEEYRRLMAEKRGQVL
ncbi:hypothetical protein N7495_005762 [Penicillium taxi]|uniref:uncharacterized protein n=1 Tax=Penicillium taxi TaxID=168475 RepID=UPI0025454151|nr:uncharacterized protein N7495_005762 [Penicillium taxi]KAJ5894071.1 hypothetical protein N7495_005762 [Penicillium taxi]